MKWFNILLVVLTLGLYTTGCSSDSDEKPNVSFSDTSQVYDPLAQDDEDRSMNDPTNESDYEADGIVDGTSVYVDENGSDAYASYSYRPIGQFKTYGTRNGGRQAWRIPGPMSKFGSVCKVTFSSGDTYYVRAQKANRSNSGFVWKRGSHGGPYVHARYGNRSQSVNISCR